MFEKLRAMENRYDEIEQRLSQPSAYADQSMYRSLTKEFAELEKPVQAYRRWRVVKRKVEEAQHILRDSRDDHEMTSLAKDELAGATQELHRLEEELRSMLSRESVEDVDFIMEIRAGTGGAEAGLFAADLHRMYLKYAISREWSVEAMGSHPTESGGFKEVVFGVSGPGAFTRLQFESGVHRVQRVPATEASGRIHTSTATVAVLPEPKEVELQINPNELKIDVFRSSGPGGQSVNTTDSAVRLTHLPTGVVVTCQDERSQLKNKLKAIRVLRARLMDFQQSQQLAEIADTRRTQIGTGERSEKIRTYNFPDRRVTDHRIGLTVYNLPDVLEGNLDAIIDGLLQAAEQKSLGINDAGDH